MLEDALKSVKEAEKKAGILIEEADAKAASIAVSYTHLTLPTT